VKMFIHFKLCLTFWLCGDNHDKEYASSLPDKVDFNYHIKTYKLPDRWFCLSWAADIKCT